MEHVHDVSNRDTLQSCIGWTYENSWFLRYPHRQQRALMALTQGWAIGAQGREINETIDAIVAGIVDVIWRSMSWDDGLTCQSVRVEHEVPPLNNNIRDIEISHWRYRPNTHDYKWIIMKPMHENSQGMVTTQCALSQHTHIGILSTYTHTQQQSECKWLA